MFKKFFPFLIVMAIMIGAACEPSSSTQPQKSSTESKSAATTDSGSGSSTSSGSGSSTENSSVARETEGDMKGGNAGVASDTYNSGSSGYAGRDGATQYQQDMIQSQQYGSNSPHSGPSTVYTGPR